MVKYIINGGRTLNGTTTVSGAKNVALKALVAACMTDEEVTIENLPIISDVAMMIEIIKGLGGVVEQEGHAVRVKMEQFKSTKIPLEAAAEVRTSLMFFAPLLARMHEAIIPNPGGCRIGTRPIDRIIDGVRLLAANVAYRSEDGYFYAKTNGLQGATYRFEKNSHTGTETLILSAVLAHGRTILENAAEEPEIEELINMLSSMGALIKRQAPRTIVIDGVRKLHGTKVIIGPDRNEVVTLAVAAILTKGDILIRKADYNHLQTFLSLLQEANGGYEVKKDGIRFFYRGPLQPTNVTTGAHPAFMTDWQGPWCVLMTQAKGTSIIHETVFENRFGYVQELLKMGANITLFNPEVEDPRKVYNFNIKDDKPWYFHAARISGPTRLHNAVVKISDIRAGATLVLAALAAEGQTIIFGVDKLDRGYEKLEKRLTTLGADIKRVRI